MNPQEVIEKLESLKKGAVDLVVDSRRVRANVLPIGWGFGFDSVPELEGETYHLSDWSKGQVSQKLGIPAAYFKRMDMAAPTLLSQNINHWLGCNTDGKNLIRLGKIEPDGDVVVRAVLSDRYAAIDNYDVTWMTLKAAKETGNISFDKADLSQTRLYLRLLNKEPVELGDKNRPDPWYKGCVVGNSEVGNGATSISPYLFRTACSNGMVLGQRGIRKIHLGQKMDSGIFSPDTIKAEGNVIFMKMKDVMRSCLVEDVLFQDTFDSIRESRNIKFETSIFKSAPVFDLTDEEKSCILEVLYNDETIDKPLQSTQWGITNAITAYAKTLGPDRRFELERTAEKFVSMTPASVMKIRRDYGEM